MNFSQYLVAFITAFLTLAILDTLYITLGGYNRYKKNLGGLLRLPLNWVPTVPLYFISIAGFVYFAIRPALIVDDLLLSILNSMFLGLLFFSFYELTNLATLKNWPLKFALMEIAWGVFASAFIGASAFLAVKLI